MHANMDIQTQVVEISFLADAEKVKQLRWSLAVNWLKVAFIFATLIHTMYNVFIWEVVCMYIHTYVCMCAAYTIRG